MRFVLVHGSWHDGDCWNGVGAHLKAAGHEVHAPTLPGNGSQAQPTVTMAETAAAVIDLINTRDLTDVVLVGHSFGGAVVQVAAPQVVDRLARLIFHNAYVVEHGRSVFSYVPASAAESFTALASADGTLSLPFDYFREHLINDATDEQAAVAYAAMSPEPLARSGEELDLAAFQALDVPRSYVYARDDLVFPAEEFTWHPGMSSHLAEFRLVEVAGSHELLFSDPKSLAQALVEACRD